MDVFPSMSTSLVFLFSFIIFLFFIRFKWISFHSNTNKNLPPSPQKLPVIGNLHQLAPSPHRSLRALSQKHGPLMTIHLGSVPVIVGSSANVAREIMKTHDLTFSGRPKLTMPDILLYGCTNISFAPYGERWRRLKSIAVVHLLNNARVQSFRKGREDEVARTIDIIGESCGSIVNLSGILVSLANDIVCRLALGKAYRDSKLTTLLARFIELMGVFNVGNYIPWLSWIDRVDGLKGRAERVARDLDEFIKGVVQEHENKKTQSDEDHNIVDILLHLEKDLTAGFTITRHDVKVIILDVFVGATDTTFTTIDWTISLLIRHPRVMKKLQNEITEIAQGKSMIDEDDLKKMEYLKAVIKETLRLHPPLPLLAPRETTQDVKLMGYDIRAGTQVIINAWAIGRDPTSWGEEPEEFRPERFLNNPVDHKGLHFEFLPFGGGRRGCPGNQFAIAIAELTLANLVYKFDFKLPNGAKNEDLDMSETNGIEVHKKFPLLVIATPRF